MRVGPSQVPIEGDKGSGCEARTVPATVYRQLRSFHQSWPLISSGGWEGREAYAFEPEVRKPCLLLDGSDHLRSGKGRVASSAKISVRVRQIGSPSIT